MILINLLKKKSLNFKNCVLTGQNSQRRPLVPVPRNHGIPPQGQPNAQGSLSALPQRPQRSHRLFRLVQNVAPTINIIIID